MKRYEVVFEEIVTQSELNKVIVEAESEEEAAEMVVNYDFDEVESIKVDVLDTVDFNITSVNEI